MPPRSLRVPVPGSALLLIDVINDLDFTGCDRLVAQAERMPLRLEALKRRAAAAGLHRQMQIVMKADVTPSDRLTFRRRRT